MMIKLLHAVPATAGSGREVSMPPAVFVPSCKSWTYTKMKIQRELESSTSAAVFYRVAVLPSTLDMVGSTV